MYNSQVQLCHLVLNDLSFWKEDLCVWAFLFRKKQRKWFFCRIFSLSTDDEFGPKPIKYKVNVSQKSYDELIFEFVLLYSVLFWIALHLLYLILQL